MKKKSSKVNSISKDNQIAPEIQAAIDYGIDISMLEDNLKRSVEDRLLQHQIALNTYEKLQKAKLL